MAEKRMFAKSIVLTDAFLDMPMSARCLYFTLGMLADDDGFVGSPKSIMRQCGASQDDMAILLSKRFVLGFDSGVIVIKHWRINNYLQKDRIKPTTYQEELSTLMLDQKGAYTERNKGKYPECIQDVYTEEISIDKNSLVQSSTAEDSKGEFEGGAAACQKKKYGKYVELSFKEFSAILTEYGYGEMSRRIKAVDIPENEGKDFYELIREAKV